MHYEVSVPAVIERAIQAAMAMILNEIYEQDFLKCSFGFRAGCILKAVIRLVPKCRMREICTYGAVVGPAQKWAGLPDSLYSLC